MSQKPTRIQFGDVTLRDGEQSPGASMRPQDKVTLACQLETLGVDSIEAGFAASSEGDAEAIMLVAQTVKEATVISLCGTDAKDVDTALKSVESAKYPGIHTFMGTSELHRKYKFHKSWQQIMDAACSAVRQAARYTDYIEFSAEDATRTSRERLREIYGAVIAEGATVCNVPDTVGRAVPEEFGPLIQWLIEHTPDGRKVIWSAHCHNDLGLAVVNSLAAIQHGARRIECCVNGIGERAGNAAFETIVAALKTRHDFYGFTTRINAKKIYSTSRLLAQITGLTVSVNQPVVGANAFAHEAGIHQAGVLAKRETYEALDHRKYGIESNRLVLAKHSGRRGLNARLEYLGVKIGKEALNEVFKRFKALADLKLNGEIYDEDLLALVAEDTARATDRYKLAYLNVTSSSVGMPHATVKIQVDDATHLGDGSGDGMVDACFSVISKIVGFDVKLERYAVKAITGGADAQGEVSVLISANGYRDVSGNASHTDIIMASALAYISALNKLANREKYLKQVKEEACAG